MSEEEGAEVPEEQEPAEPRVLDFAAALKQPGLKLKTVAEFQDVVEAELALSTMWSEGIAAVVVNELTTALGPYVSGAMGAQLQVREEDVGPARAVLDEIAQRRKDRIEREAKELPASRCPQCGATGLKRQKIFTWTVVVVLLLLAGPMIVIGGQMMLIGLAIAAAIVWMRSGRYRCEQCGSVVSGGEESPAEEDKGDEA